MAEIPDNAAGISATAGLDDYVIEGPLDEYGPMVGVLVHGEEYPYRTKAISESVTDYETGRGVWDSATNTITRATIKTSSNSNNKVDWPSGTKSIFIVADEEALKDMGKMAETSSAKVMTSEEREDIRNIVAPFPGKPKGEPIFLVVTGQSNQIGVYQDTPTSMPINSNVFDLQSEVPLTAPYAFEIADPLRDSGFSSGVMVGMRGQTGGTAGSPYGNVGWSCANALEQWTGRPVYMVQVAKSGEPISGWDEAAEVEAHLSARVSQALTLLQATWPNITAPDAVIWWQGESDISRDPEDYADDFIAFKENMESKWASRWGTQWLMCTLSPALIANTYFSGIERAAQRLDNNARLVSGEGLTFVDVYGHADGPSLNQQGVQCARELLAPSSQSNLSPRDAKFLSWLKGAASSDVEDAADAIAYDFDTANALVNAAAKLVSWKNNGSEKAYLDKDGKLKIAELISDVADGASAVAHILDTVNDLTTAGAKLVSLRKNGSEIAYIDKDGSLAVTGYHSDVADGASAIAHSFDTTNNLTNQSAALVEWKNAGVQQAWIDSAGGLHCRGFNTNFLGLTAFSNSLVFLDETVGITSVMTNGTNRTAFNFNCATTLSHTSAKLMDFQIGGTSKFYLNQAGQPVMPALPTSDPGVAGAIWRDGSDYLRVS